MKLYLVRHGITDWNARKKIQGQVDIPLNEEGKRLARETAEGLSDVPFDLCISSPLCRAKETARIILRNRKTLDAYQELDILITTHGAALAGLLNNIKNEPLSCYWGSGVHRNCAVTEVEVINGVPKILSENVVYYQNVKDPWAEDA